MTEQKSLFLDTDFEEVQITPQPVTCLGMTFESDEARRAYFREELRKRLPELRKIEGFPIGEDDDIINLSDPPYYTACPNPWLNDFIEQWEMEKVQLKAEGKRSDNFEVKMPYASDVSEGKNNPIYMAHAYHTKVPHPAIMRYILHYTQPGDIVFDGFAGTGMTGVAAQLCGDTNEVQQVDVDNARVGIRKGICSDLSPIASVISASYNLPFNPISFKKKAIEILNRVESELGWMYETKVNGNSAKVNYTIWSDVFTCSSCGSELSLWKEAVNLEKNTISDKFTCPFCGAECSKKNVNKSWELVYDDIVKESVEVLKKTPVRVNYTLSSGKRGEKDFDEYDLLLLNQISLIKVDNIRLYALPHGEKTDAIRSSNKIEYIHQLFTKRNNIYLARVLELVKNEGLPIAWFTSILQNASVMYKFRTDRKGGILNGTLFIPSLNIEQSPYFLLKRKIKDFTNSSYKGRGNSCIGISSATCLSQINDNSIDYIFVDPPFGSNIMYSEVNAIWEAWLGVFTNTKEEAVINRKQNKTLFDYQALMTKSLKEFYRVLKPNKWITIEFSNTSASVWNSIQNALQGVGFVVSNVSSIDKKQGSFNAVTSTTAVKQDLVITCFKPSDELLNKFTSISDKDKNIWEFVNELLQHLPVHLFKESSTTAIVERSSKILYDRLIAYYVQHGYAVPIDAIEFQKGLKERFIERDGMYFTASQALEYEEKRAKSDGFVPMALFIGSEADGIEWLKRKLETPKTYQELQPDWMKDLVAPKKGDVLPGLDVILEENFIKGDDGKWSKPDPENASHLEQLRGKRMMKVFNIYLEAAKKPKAKRMKDTRLEVLRYGFKDCYKQKNYQDIVTVGEHIPESLLMEDEILLQYYDIAVSRI